MAKEKKKKDTRDKLYAKTAFYISLGFWIPLFNIGLCVTSLILAILALKQNYKDPKTYGGFNYAVWALVISIASIIITIVGGIIYLMSSRICATAICQSVLAAKP